MDRSPQTKRWTWVLRTFQTDAGIAEPLARQVHERAEGIPTLWRRSSSRSWDSEKLFLQDGRWLGWEVEDLELPASVTEAVSARFSELSPAAQEVANVLAVAGTRVDHELLSTVAEQAEADMLAGLDQLRTTQLIDEAAHGAHIVYQFVHPLVQEVIYSEMGLARARTLHQRMGEALERGEAAVIDDPALPWPITSPAPAMTTLASSGTWPSRDATRWRAGQTARPRDS